MLIVVAPASIAAATISSRNSSSVRLASSGLKSRLLLQVHDELVLEIAPGEHQAVEDLVRREMGAAYQLDVPLDVSIGSGLTWHEAAH